MLTVSGFFHSNNWCIKCGGKDISASYRKAGTSSGYPHFQREEHDVIDRHCRRCSYEWAEWTIDSEPAIKAITAQAVTGSTRSDG